MTFGPDHDTGARITDLEQYKSCLDVFQKAGYDEVDTARVYVGGKQEGFTAQAGWKERGLTIATKWYPNDLGAHKPETLKAKVEESLKALETDSVDIFYLHVSRPSEWSTSHFPDIEHGIDLPRPVLSFCCFCSFL
jgi:aflatoxin B1 aldehyde reductase